MNHKRGKYQPLYIQKFPYVLDAYNKFYSSNIESIRFKYYKDFHKEDLNALVENATNNGMVGITKAQVMLKMVENSLCKHEEVRKNILNLQRNKGIIYNF